MESRSGLIDLGVFSYQAGPELPGPRRRQPARIRLRRWWPVVLVTVLAWPLGGAVAAPAPPLVPLWTAPGSLRDGHHGVDPVTGTSRWSVGCPDFGITGECALRRWGTGPEGRLVVSPYALEPAPDQTTRQVILDTATGRPVTAPTVWNVVAWQDSSLLLSRVEDVAPEGAEYPLADNLGPYPIWWARSDPDLERIEVLGVIEAVGCTSHDAYLLCYGADGTVEVWRVR